MGDIYRGGAQPDCPEDGFAVIGMSINVAGADDIEGFWDLIMGAKSQHVEVPAERFTFKSTAWRPVDPTRKWYGNFIADYDAFDHKFFKKSPREALYADPQQRLFLQCAYQAVEQSGYFNIRDPDKHVGVYVGVGSAEYEGNFACHPTNAFSATGNLKSAIAGRVSHFFGWTGPGLAVDTACSASAVAMHLACRAIQNGDCTAALVGGTQMLTSPFHFQNLAGASFLSPTGPCKPFDVDADGYCRGEGVGAVFIKKMSDALADGDYILGRIASTAVLQNDSSTPMFVPNADSLARLFDTVIRSAKLRPEDISAIEAHGTGTQRGDPAEMEGICRALGGPNGRADPLPVMSVKSVVGHTECASGMVSLVKILLMLQKGVIPMQAGFRQINPSLRYSPEDRIEIPTRHQTWTADSKAALINSFGASGSNSAMVVTEVQSKSSKIIEPGGAHPFWIATADTRSLAAYANKLADFVGKSDVSLTDISLSLSRQSNRALARSLVFQASNKTDLITKLHSYDKCENGLSAESGSKDRPVILCFGGQTSKTIRLSRKLFDTVPLFRSYLDHCEFVLQRQKMGTLYPAIFQKDPVDDIVQLQIALFAVQYACARVWIDCGVQVASVVGHSFGELTCLAVTGRLSLEDTIRVIHTRATLVQDHWGPDPGAMMAVESELENVLALLGEGPIDIGSDSSVAASIACYNGPTSFTLAGSTEAMRLVEARVAKSSAVKGKRLPVSNAFHCSLVDPLLDKLKLLTQGLAIHEQTIAWERATEDQLEGELGSDFFATHMRQPVHAHSAFERLHQQYPTAIWLEAGTNSTITRMAKKALSMPKTSYFQALDLTRDETVLDNLVSVTEGLWKEGLNVCHWTHHPFQRQAGRYVLLPPYQFEKSRHWLEWKDPESIVVQSIAEAASRPTVASDGLCTFAGYLDSERRSACFQINPTASDFEQAFSGYVDANTGCRCSVTLAMSTAIEACSLIRPETDALSMLHEHSSVIAREPLILKEARQIWLTLQFEGSDERISWRWVLYSTDTLGKGRTVHFEGRLEFAELSNVDATREMVMHQRLVQHGLFTELYRDTDANETIQGRGLYKVFSEAIEYSDAYKGLYKVVSKQDKCAGRIRLEHRPNPRIDPFYSDCILQVSSYWLNCINDRATAEHCSIAGFDKWIKMPEAYIGRRDAGRSLEKDVYATHLKTTEGRYVADLFVFDPATKQLTEVITGLHFASSPRTQHQRTALQASATNFSQPSLGRVSQSDAQKLPRPSDSLSTEPQPHPDQASQSTAQAVYQVLSSLSGVEKAMITQTTVLEDIGIDSLVEIELIADLRKCFGCDFAASRDWKKVLTVADLVRWVEVVLGTV